MDSQFEFKAEKHLLKRLRQAHYNLVNRFIEEILKEIMNEKNSIQTYAKEWVVRPELQKLVRYHKTGIRLDYLRNENRMQTCHYRRLCNINKDGNRVLNELLGSYNFKNDYCTCFSYYRTWYEYKLRRFGIDSIGDLETKKIFLIPISKINSIKYDLQGLKPIIVWAGTYWNSESHLFDKKLHRKAGIRRTPWNEIRKTLIEDYGINLQYSFFENKPDYLEVELLPRYYQLQKLKLIQKLFPEDVVKIHIKPFLGFLEYHPKRNPDISIFFKNSK